MGGGINFSPDLIKKIPLRLDKLSENIKNNVANIYPQLKKECSAKIKQEQRLKQILKFELQIKSLPKPYKDLSKLDEGVVKYSPNNVDIDKKLNAMDLISSEKGKLVLIYEKINHLINEIDNIILDLYDITSDVDKKLINDFKSI